MVQRTDPQAKRAKLEAWLRKKMPSAENVLVSQLEKAAGGYGSEIHFFDASWQEGGQEKTEKLVIREEPMAFRVFPEYNMVREFNTMKSLQDSDVPVPKIYWLEEDDRVLGAPFFIMGKVDGEIIDPQQFADVPRGPIYEANPEERSKIWRQSLEVVAKINTVDCEKLGLSDVGAPGCGIAALDRQIGFYEWMAEWAEIEPRSLVEGAFDWFKKNRFEPAHICLCWGDARPANLMYRDGEITAVLDWDMTHIGAAETDLAWFLAIDWLNGDEGLGGRPYLEGMPDRKESIRIYEGAVGRKLENLFYHEAFAFFRLGIIFGRVVKSIPGIPPEYIPQNLPLLKLANMLSLGDRI